MALRHDAFIVYDPADRELAARFVERFRDVLIPRWREVQVPEGPAASGDAGPPGDRPRVRPAEAAPRVADGHDVDLLDRLRREHVWEAAITIVLTGACTWARRSVDWSIAAALRDGDVGRRTALLGIRLPGLPPGKPAVVPERFADNVDSGYATFRDYPVSSEELRAWVEGALVARQYGTPDNARALRSTDGACP